MSKNARIFHARPGPALKRWLGVLLTSILLHWIVLEWVNGNLVFPLQIHETESVITAQLQSVSASSAAPEAITQPAKTRPKPAARRPAARPPKAPRTVPAQAAPSDTAAAQTVAETENENLTNTDHGGDAEPIPSPVNLADKRDETSPNYEMNLPPSAELKYDVQAQKKGFSYYGTGIINWQANGSHYAITGKAKAAFFTVLEFKSTGEIDKTGIAPVLYAERSGNRAETNTHFHRERNTISFSASTLSYPRLGGEQDRASIIWQLAAMGRASPELFRAGEELNIFVAGVRNAAPWRIYIIGEEEIQLDNVPVKSWHVKSVPQQGGYEKTFDIWFASGIEWYPVKLRQTEVNGDYLELNLSNMVLAQQ
jgi:hypothetical protein